MIFVLFVVQTFASIIQHFSLKLRVFWTIDFFF